jgi:hypothetical protein
MGILMSALSKLGVFAGVVVACSIAVGLVAAGRFVLVAQERIVVDSYPVPDPTRFAPAGTLDAGVRVPVLSCDDLKSYSAIHIRLQDGKEGYVIKGRFALEKVSLWSASEAPISYSCPPAWH